MGTGSQIAIEGAGLTLPKGDLVGLVRARVLAEATMANIRQNLWLAFGYNALGRPDRGRRALSGLRRPAVADGGGARHEPVVGIGDRQRPTPRPGPVAGSELGARRGARAIQRHDRPDHNGQKIRHSRPAAFNGISMMRTAPKATRNAPAIILI